jgi:hypothetical protein
MSTIEDEGGFYRLVDTGKVRRSKIEGNKQPWNFKYEKGALIDMRYRLHLFYTIHHYGVGDLKDSLLS